ncbi:hypothetical protein M413DRAFT_449458 [Hebeloma cylindrosporum]|uniref:Uncharacterized protein n=1 Tax=Hebeloma cylindrosporum TaxID=76867 RepID=A0A0C2XDJ4_HEBCY|nr:hypothetical protein M413DRAFT_449458 [Hebeloma cylindrosporum h7]
MYVLFSLRQSNRRYIDGHPDSDEVTEITAISPTQYSPSSPEPYSAPKRHGRPHRTTKCYTP